MIPSDVAIPSDLLCALHALQDADRTRAGTKAATIAQLAQAGLAVPEGVVLYSDAAASVLDGAGLGPESAPSEVLAAELPADVEAALEAVTERFGDALLAVRSSASAEDLAGASFAGQYETVLGVRGLDELRAAVRRCWASAYAGRVRGYASVHGQAAGSPPAVLIQRQVQADVAGVAFSANPVSGARDEALVSAVPGLGDDLVSGRRPADEWVVRGRDATAVRVVHQALTEAQAQAIAGVAVRIEALLGGPQDVEWAMACGRLLVLQARPVTALPRAPEVHLAPGTWVKEEGRHPEPLTALGASGAARFVADGLTSMWAAYGGLLESIELRAIGGEPYAHVVPVGGHEGTPPPWWALGLLARVAPPLRRRMATARRMVRPEVLDGLIERWYSEWRPELQASTAQLREVDLAGLSDDELEVHLGRAIDLTHRALKIHFHLIPPVVVPLYELAQACKRLLGWDTPAALQLLAGTSMATSEPALALAQLGERIRGRPRALAVAERADPDVGRLLDEADPELGAAFAAWCDAYALRCVNNDPGSPLLAERPWLLARLLADAVA
ncbi:MAG: PEP/pyruvate-binding domain-containing protein, partial [Solirubrobacteraceae bacterium]